MYLAELMALADEREGHLPDGVVGIHSELAADEGARCLLQSVVDHRGHALLQLLLATLYVGHIGGRQAYLLASGGEPALALLLQPLALPGDIAGP